MILILDGSATTGKVRSSTAIEDSQLRQRHSQFFFADDNVVFQVRT
jgi:hypothetical protein